MRWAWAWASGEVALDAAELAGQGGAAVLLLCVAAAVWWGGMTGAPLRRARVLFPRVGTGGGGRLWSGWPGGAFGGGVVPGWRGAPLSGGALFGSGWAGVAERLCRPGALLPCVPVLAGGLLAIWQWSVLPLIAGVAAAVVVRRWWLRRARHREAERLEAAVVELCAGVSAELRAGRQPHEALLAAGVGELGPPETGVLAAARFGGDLPTAFRRASHRPGGAGLGGVAACWQVAAEGGAGLAAGLDRVAYALRVERDQREDLQAQLAGPRATVAVLAGLPLLGVSLGTVMGADPLRVLLHTPVGWALLAAALALECLGVLWVRGIVRSAARGPAGKGER